MTDREYSKNHVINICRECIGEIQRQWLTD